MAQNIFPRNCETASFRKRKQFKSILSLLKLFLGKVLLREWLGGLLDEKWSKMLSRAIKEHQVKQSAAREKQGMCGPEKKGSVIS